MTAPDDILIGDLTLDPDRSHLIVASDDTATLRVLLAGRHDLGALDPSDPRAAGVAVLCERVAPALRRGRLPHCVEVVTPDTMAELVALATARRDGN